MKGGTTQTQSTSQIKQPTDSNSKKPTAEQIRYAQLLSNEDIRVVQDQIRQVADVTGRSHDEVSVALHDCNYDTELTINSLLEGRFDQNEWIMPSSRKKKHQGGGGTTSQGIDNIISGKQQKDAPRQSRGSRGGRNRASDKTWDSEQRDNDENRPPDSGRGRGVRDDRSSSERKPPAGRGGPPRRGRGGGKGRSSSRGRGGRIGKGGPPVSQPSSNGPTINGTEMWDNIIDAEEDKEKTESKLLLMATLVMMMMYSKEVLNDGDCDDDNAWEDTTQPTEVWGNDDYIHLPPASVKEPVAPASVASLFSSVTQSNSWTNDSKEQPSIPWGNGETITTNGTAVTSSSREQTTDSTTFTPESVDIAIIHSKLAQNPSRPSDQSQTTNDMSSMMHISLPTNINHNHLGPISKLLDSVSIASLTQQQTSHTQPQRQPKTSRSKKSQKSQIPLQAVEMPDSMMDELDVQFGNLEFGGDFSGSPLKTKAMDSTVSMPTEDDRASKQKYVKLESEDMKPDPIPFPKQLRADDVHSEQAPDRPKTPPSTNDNNSSLTGSTRSQAMSTAGLQSQLVSSLPKENTLDSRAYQVGQHVATQPSSAGKDQLSTGTLGHHNTLGGTTMTTSQRTDSTTHPLQPPPGVGVPHSTSQQASSSMSLSTATVSSSSRPAQHSGKPSLPPGVLPINTLYGMQQPGMVPGYSMPFTYEELQRQMHIPPAYYDMSFQTGRENMQGTFPTDQKFGRSDASSPVQTTINQPQGQHHMQQQQQHQQAYLNAASMSPYGFGGLAFYPGGGMMPGGFPTYSAPAMYQQMAPKTHVNVSQYQQQAFNSQHGSHVNYSSGYDDLSGGHDFNKSPYHSTVSQTQSKSTPVVSTSSDLGGASSYKTQIGK
ncbi:hypothetical protein QZH41_011123, partial [Actinostola sp. cb2023]